MNVSDTGGQGGNQRHHQKVGRDGGGHTFDQEGKSGLKILVSRKNVPYEVVRN